MCLLTSLQDLQTLASRLRADIVAVRTSADHMEEKLKAEILFLKEQIQAEQCLKENLEDTLQLEIEGCKEEIGGRPSVTNTACPSKNPKNCRDIFNFCVYALLCFCLFLLHWSFRHLGRYEAARVNVPVTVHVLTLITVVHLPVSLFPSHVFVIYLNTC